MNRFAIHYTRHWTILPVHPGGLRGPEDRFHPGDLRGLGGRFHPEVQRGPGGRFHPEVQRGPGDRFHPGDLRGPEDRFRRLAPGDPSDHKDPVCPVGPSGLGDPGSNNNDYDRNRSCFQSPPEVGAIPCYAAGEKTETQAKNSPCHSRGKERIWVIYPLSFLLFVFAGKEKNFFSPCPFPRIITIFNFLS